MLNNINSVKFIESKGFNIGRFIKSSMIEIIRIVI